MGQYREYRHTDQHTDDQHDQTGKKANDKRNSRAVDHADAVIASEVVGAHDVREDLLARVDAHHFLLGVLKGAQVLGGHVLLGVVVGVEHRHEDRNQRDGDEDDEKTAGSKDKLKAMITEDPDAVVDFLKQLSSGLYKELDKSMKSSSVSSAYTIYNDKQMDKEYKDYTTQIKEWEKRIAAKEEAYFKQFSAMEAALAKMQSSASSITGMMGGN